MPQGVIQPIGPYYWDDSYREFESISTVVVADNHNYAFVPMVGSLQPPHTMHGASALPRQVAP